MRFISSRSVNSCSGINLRLQALFLTRNNILQPSAAINFTTSANQELFSNKTHQNGAFWKAKWALGVFMMWYKEAGWEGGGGGWAMSVVPSLSLLCDGTTMRWPLNFSVAPVNSDLRVFPQLSSHTKPVEEAVRWGRVGAALTFKGWEWKQSR